MDMGPRHAGLGEGSRAWGQGPLGRGAEPKMRAGGGEQGEKVKGRTRPHEGVQSVCLPPPTPFPATLLRLCGCGKRRRLLVYLLPQKDYMTLS